MSATQDALEKLRVLEAALREQQVRELILEAEMSSCRQQLASINQKLDAARDELSKALSDEWVEAARLLDG